MPKEISSSYKGKDHKSDAPIHNVASPKKSRRYDATLSSEAYHYCLHQTRDHTSSQQEVGKPEQSMIVEKGSGTHQYAASPKREVLRLRGGADDYDDYGYGYGDPYDLGGYEDYGWHEDDAERYRDYGWHEDNEERYRDDEAYGNPSDQWKKDLASTSGMSAWERDQQTEVQYEWLEEGREREAGERSKIHGDEKREEEDFEALRAEAMELIRQSEMKDEKREEEDFEALRAEAMELIRQSEMKDEKREEEDFEALRAEAMELIRQSEMKDEKREEEDFEALRAEAMELIRQLEMKEGEVRQHDSGEYEDQEEVGQHDDDEHDGGQGDGNGGGDGGNRGVHDGYENDSDEDAAPTDLSAVRADYSELDQELLQIEEKLSFQGKTHLFQVIESVSQKSQIVGFDEWVVQSTNREAARMLDTVMELAEARRVLQEYKNDPDVTIDIGQDVQKGYDGELSFDIVVKDDGTILCQIEVFTPGNGDIQRYGQAFIDAITHAADKIEKYIAYKKDHPEEFNGSESPPRGSLEATIAIVPWPPDPIPMGGDAQLVYNTHGEHTVCSVADPTVIRRGPINVLEEVVNNSNLSKAYDELPVEFIRRLNVIDENGQALFELTNQDPGVKYARWTWKDLQGDS